MLLFKNDKDAKMLWDVSEWMNEHDVMLSDAHVYSLKTGIFFASCLDYYYFISFIF